MKEGIGHQFQMETKYQREPYSPGAIEGQQKREKLKEKLVDKSWPLPSPDREDGWPLFKAINSRRSVREFRKKPVSLAALSQILWAAQGITLKAGDFSLRTAPSAGALYPIDIYVCVQAVDTLKPGLYHFLPAAQALRMRYEGDFSQLLADAALNQDFLAEASLVLVLTAVFERTTWKYGARGFRYLYLDAGHIAQNAALAAVSLGLGSCPVAAFFDDEINALLGVNPARESAVYLLAVGWPRK
ncbi:MAG: SagB/ThcOx family dehydrogenase [Candidatus Aminicenantes bacterium]|nr:SagB/ThcOx family dehydrogenase [Candidatus Aminicenantes bacterium]